MSWYKSGTIAASNGSKIITGTGTQFTNSLNGVSEGRMLLLPAAGTVQIYEIESVQSDTQLTLVSAFTGTTGTGKAYAIPTSPAVSIEQFAHEFAATLAYYQQQLSGWQQILTGTGNVTLTTPDGQNVTVRSQKAWDDALNGKVTGVKQTSSTDSTLNAIMALAGDGTGSFGIGGTAPRMPVDSDVAAFLRSMPSGKYAIPPNSSATNLPVPGSLSGWTFETTKFNSTPLISVIARITDASGTIYHGLINNTTVTWCRFWDSANLVKQTGPFDATANSLLINGAWGWGGSGQALTSITTDADLLSYFRSTNAPSGIFRADHVGNYTKQYGTGIFARAGDLWTVISAGSRAQGSASVLTGVKISTGNSAGTLTQTYEVWTDKNLVKQSSRLAASGEVLMAGFNGGIGRLSSDVIPDGVLASDFRYGGAWYAQTIQQTDTPSNGHILNIFSHPTGNYGAQLWIDYRNSSPNFYFRTIDNNVVGEWHPLATLDTTQTITGSKIFTSSISIRTPGSGGLELGSITTASQSFIDFHSSGNNIDYDARILSTGGTTGLGGANLNVIAASFTWNNYNLATLQRDETFTGAKTFSSPIQDTTLQIGQTTTTIASVALTAITQFNAMRNGQTLLINGNTSTAGLMPSGVSSGYWHIKCVAKADSTANAGSFEAYQLGLAYNYYVGSLSSSGTITWRRGLFAGYNAIADSNGFWKTASPVVKLFADGTSELTSEAEGITTERLSEGVYRISGCLGLNADLAWGGIEGGISCPKCRNGLERVWNDYDVEADGSIVIRTYHRPHPDAPVFARNEIEGYANGDPIDIPHDTFISVRVQMPECEEPKPKVMHSNVYCGSVP